MFQTTNKNLKTIEFDQIVSTIRSNLLGPKQKGSITFPIFTSFEDLNNSQAQINEIIAFLQNEKGFPLREFEDLDESIKQLKPLNSRLSPQDYLKIADQLELVRDLKQLSEKSEIEIPLFDILVKKLDSNKQLIKQIKKIIDKSGVLDTASSDLRQIRRKKINLESKLRSSTNNLATTKYKSYLIDSETTVRNGRVVLSVKSEHVSEIDGVIVDHSATGSTVYMEPHQSIRISSDHQKLLIDEQREIDRLLKQLADEIRPNLASIYTNQGILCEIDILHAKSLYAIRYGACFPKINTVNYQLTLKDAYHPILLETTQKDEIQPLEINFGSQDSRIVLISGPNAGGKTVALKTIGLLQLMFQSAIPIPCNPKSQLPIFRKFFCDIGDEQSILNDLSTFSSHMKHIKEILKNASVDSLILIDELGTGTDPKEGAALSQALLSRFIDLGAKVVATSHLGDLKLFANNSEAIQNASMQFDDEKMKSTFKLIMGIPGQSNAFAIAERLGIDLSIIKMGRSLMDNSELVLEDLISELNQKLKSVNSLEDDITQQLSLTKKAELNYKLKLEKLEKSKDIEKQLILDQAELLLSDINKSIENNIQKIKQSNASKEVILEAKTNIKELKTRFQNLKNKKVSKTKYHSFVIGDFVKHYNYSTIGEIIGKNGNRFEIQIGHFKMTVSKDDLEFIRSKSEQERKQVTTANYTGIQTQVKNEINLRGLNFDEAWLKCDEYLEYAISVGWETVSLIHGKGTGVLRNKLNQQLKRDNRILTKRFGISGEGDMGVTIVTLKK